MHSFLSSATTSYTNRYVQLRKRLIKNQIHLEKYRIKHIEIIIAFVITIISCNGQSEIRFQEGQVPANPSVYANELSEGIVYFSNDSGLTWEDKSNGLPSKVTVGIGSLAVFDNSLGIATKEDGIFLFDLQNQAWIPIPTDEEIIKNNLGTLAFFENQIYIGTQLNGVYTTSDDGKNWKNIKKGINNLTIRKLVTIGSKLYAGTNAGLYSFDINHENWELEYDDRGLQVNGITEYDGNIYIGTNRGIYANVDNQREWKKILEGYSVHNVSSDDRHIYAMTYNELLSSKDKGINWKSIQSGLPKELYTFEIIKNENLVFAGQWDGVYKRNNEYDRWESYSKGLPRNLAITNIKLYKDFIVVSGNERGLRKGMTTDK